MAAGHVHGRRVDPADMAIRPAVNQVDAAVPGMPEHQDRAPIMSSSITPSLTASRFSAVVDCAMMTGSNSVTSPCASLSGAAIT
jgi:hypothetical protein